MNIIKKIIRRLHILRVGELGYAVECGMKIGEGVTEIGGVNYGSEPYLITLGNNVRISNNVQFVTHDGGSFVFRRYEKYKDVVHYGRITVGNDVFIGARVIINNTKSIAEKGYSLDKVVDEFIRLCS